MCLSEWDKIAEAQIWLLELYKTYMFRPVGDSSAMDRKKAGQKMDIL